MFHVKQTINKTFDAQPLKEGCIKCFAVKVKLQQAPAMKAQMKAEAVIVGCMIANTIKPTKVAPKPVPRI